MQTKDNSIAKKLRPYMQALPDIFTYQIVTKLLLAVLLFLLGRIFQALLRSSGRVAVTTGAWKFLFTTWQGILILLLGLGSLFINPQDDSPKSISIRLFMGIVKETEYQKTLGINVFTVTV